MKRTVARVLLGLTATGQGATGAWALFAPRNWVSSFPLKSHPVVAPLGPYNEHLVRDVGALLLGTALLLAFAALRPDKRTVWLAVGTNLIFDVPHLIFHLAHTSGLGSFENAFTLGGIIAPTIAIIVAALLVE